MNQCSTACLLSYRILAKLCHYAQGPFFQFFYNDTAPPCNSVTVPPLDSDNLHWGTSHHLRTKVMRVSQLETMVNNVNCPELFALVLFLGVPILMAPYAWPQTPPQSTSCALCPCSCSQQAPFRHCSHWAPAPSLPSSSPGQQGWAPSASAPHSPRQVPGAGSHFAAAQHGHLEMS